MDESHERNNNNSRSMRLTQIRPFKHPTKEHKKILMLLHPLQNESTELVAKKNLLQTGLS